MTRRVLRHTALAMQIVAIGAYFVLPLFTGGDFGLAPMALGIMATGAFCTVYFRDKGRRRALAVICAIAVWLWCLFLAVIAFAILPQMMAMPAFSPAGVYILASALGVGMALFFGRVTLKGPLGGDDNG